MDKPKYNELTGTILDASISVHKEMGPGLLESVYEHCLVKELQLRNIDCAVQVIVPLIYKGHTLDKEFRIDILIEDEIVVEVKAVDSILPVHEAQLISYLKLMDKRVGFLINFNVPLLKDGFKRYVNKF